MDQHRDAALAAGLLEVSSEALDQIAYINGIKASYLLSPNVFDALSRAERDLQEFAAKCADVAERLQAGSGPHLVNGWTSDRSL